MFKTKQLLNVFKPWGIIERFYFRHMLRASRDSSVAKPRSMLNIAIFYPWQRSLFSRQRTPGKEPLLAGNKTTTTKCQSLVTYFYLLSLTPPHLKAGCFCRQQLKPWLQSGSWSQESAVQAMQWWCLHPGYPSEQDCRHLCTSLYSQWPNQLLRTLHHKPIQGLHWYLWRYAPQVASEADRALMGRIMYR